MTNTNRKPPPYRVTLRGPTGSMSVNCLTSEDATATFNKWAHNHRENRVEITTPENRRSYAEKFAAMSSYAKLPH